MARADNASIGATSVSAAAESGTRLSRWLWIPLVLAMGVAAYWSLYRFVPFFAGDRILHTTLFFVGAAGFFLGFKAGFIASLLGLSLHIIIHNQLGQPGWGAIWRYEPGVHIAILLVGPAMGRLRSTGRKLRREVKRRQVSEHSLRTSELQHRALLERMSEGVLHCANDDTILFVNEQLCRLTGYRQQELIGGKASELLLSDEHLESLQEKIREPHDGKVTRYRTPLKTKSRAPVWAEINGAPYRDSDGKIVGRVDVLTDITDRVRAEERLATEKLAMREAESRFRQLVDHINDIFWITTADRTQMIYVSPAFDSIYGRPRMAVYANPKAVLDYVLPEDRAFLEERLETLPTGNFDHEYRILRPDGQVRWVRSRGFTVRNEEGGVFRIAGITSDVTERKHAESWRAARSASLESLASGGTFEQVLVDIAATIESHFPQSRCAIILLDSARERLRFGCAPSVPDTANALLDHFATESGGGSLSTAIARGERIIAEDVDTHPAWTDAQSAVTKFGVKSCWAEPIYSTTRMPLGSLLMFFSDSRVPAEHDIALMESYAELAGIALQRKHTQEALQQSEELLRNFVEHSPAAVAMLDTDMRYTVVSRRWLEDFGMVGENVVGRSHYEVFPETPERWKEIHARCLTGEIEKRDEDPLERAGGEIDWIRWEIRPWRRSGGDIGGIIMFAELINDRKQAKEQILRSEARYRFLVEHMPDTISELDLDGNVLFTTWSPFNAKREDMIGRSILEYFPEGERAAFRTTLDDALQARSSRDHVACFENTWWSNRVIPILEDDAAIKLLVVGTNITDRKRAEDGLRESENRYRCFFEEDLSGFFIVTADGELLACNPAFAHIIGCESVEEVMAMDAHEFHPTVEHRQRITEALKKHQRLEKVEAELRTKDGSIVHVLANFVGSFDDSGNLTEVKGYIFDNTPRKQLEEQLHQAQKMEAVGRLAGGVAHDFNNMLTSISGYNELIVNKLAPDDPLRRYADEIMRASDRAAELTRRLLEFSRKQVLEPRVIDVNDIVESMEKMLRRTIGEDIELITSVDSNLGRVEADPGIIENALLNLAINARDAMPDGGQLRIETSGFTVDDSIGEENLGLEAGSYAEITVSDTGMGMDSATQSRIFEPFFTTKEHGKGTGLGLATVYGAVRQCGGHIRVTSEPGHGAAFRMYFEVVEDRVPTTAGSRQKFLGPSQGTETILIAEDENAVRQLMRDILEAKGYGVLLAKDGQEALHVCAEHEGTIDLLVTDLVMPRMNGRELAVHAQAQNPQMKVLYISGYIGRASIRIAELGPGTSFLSKPFSSESLARKVRLLLDSGKRAAPRTSLTELTARRAIRVDSTRR